MQSLTLTPAAVAKIQSLKNAQDAPDMRLRIYVKGGGCSGFSYGFDFAHALADDDICFDEAGAGLVVDMMSYPYLAGATVDYIEGLMGARFNVDNPNASNTCGCGQSFSIG